jgi:hypothetical protein
MLCSHTLYRSLKPLTVHSKCSDRQEDCCCSFPTHVWAGTFVFTLAQSLLILELESSLRALFYLVFLLKSLGCVLSHDIIKITNRNFEVFCHLWIFSTHFCSLLKIPHAAGGSASQSKLSESWRVVSCSNCVTSCMRIANNLFYSWCFFFCFARGVLQIFSTNTVRMEVTVCIACIPWPYPRPCRCDPEDRGCIHLRNNRNITFNVILDEWGLHQFLINVVTFCR